MNYRIAKKIWKAIGGEREKRYTFVQKDKAIAIMGRSAESKESRAWWHAFLESHPEMQATEWWYRMYMEGGHPGAAFRSLMEGEDWL